MKVCEEKQTKPELQESPIPGHLYKRVLPGTYYGDIHLAVKGGTMYDVKTGQPWSLHGFGAIGPYGFEDVTDQYCLQKI